MRAVISSDSNFSSLVKKYKDQQLEGQVSLMSQMKLHLQIQRFANSLLNSLGENYTFAQNCNLKPISLVHFVGVINFVYRLALINKQDRSLLVVLHYIQEELIFDLSNYVDQDVVDIIHT